MNIIKDAVESLVGKKCKIKNYDSIDDEFYELECVDNDDSIFTISNVEIEIDYKKIILTLTLKYGLITFPYLLAIWYRGEWLDINEYIELLEA